ncbi:MAG: SMI1/KNR4 family protein [Isosphaeraceae bacterium]|nr:SMI1/KNR4 family protein [Isosphaeraceae bacterium]
MTRKKNEVQWRWAGPPIDRDVIARVEESWGISFPEDYVACALVNHGGRPKPKCFDFPGHPEAVFSHLLGYIDATSKNENLSITQMYDAVKDRLPDRIFPFAADPFGNLICFDYRGPKRHSPTVVFWNHEVDDPKQMITPICKTFTDLLEKLYEPDEED